MARRRLRPFARLGRTPPPDHLFLDDVDFLRLAAAADAGSHRVLPALGQQPHFGHRRAGAEHRRRLHGAHRPADRQHHLCEISRDRARLGVGRRQLVGQRLRGDADHRFAHHQLQHAPDRRGGARAFDLRRFRPAARGPRQYPRDSPVHGDSRRYVGQHERFGDGEHQGLRLRHGRDERHRQRPEGEDAPSGGRARRETFARRPASRVQRRLRPRPSVVLRHQQRRGVAGRAQPHRRPRGFEIPRGRRRVRHHRALCRAVPQPHRGRREHHALQCAGPPREAQGGGNRRGGVRRADDRAREPPACHFGSVNARGRRRAGRRGGRGRQTHRRVSHA